MGSGQAGEREAERRGGIGHAAVVGSEVEVGAGPTQVDEGREVRCVQGSDRDRSGIAGAGQDLGGHLAQLDRLDQLQRGLRDR